MKQHTDEKWSASRIADEFGPEAVAIGSTGAFVLLMCIGGILATGVALGLITSLGLGIILWECRTFAPKIYNFIIQHPFSVDIFTSVLFFGLMGMTVNGLIASAVFSICNSNILLLCNRYDPRAHSEPVEPLKAFFKFFKASKTNVVTRTEKEVDNTVIDAEWRTI